ncbi:uncharacterized protein METZ01_LOCUS228407, partial [marine metagenome]
SSRMNLPPKRRLPNKNLRRHPSKVLLPPRLPTQLPRLRRPSSRRQPTPSELVTKRRRPLILILLIPLPTTCSRVSTTS